MMRFFLLLCLLAGSLMLPICSFGQVVNVNDDNFTIDEDPLTPPTFDILANDNYIGLGSIDPATVDLDTGTGGVQSTNTTPEGAWSVDASGILTFQPILNFFGVATIEYNVSATPIPVSDLVAAPITITVNAVNDLPTITSP